MLIVSFVFGVFFSNNGIYQDWPATPLISTRPAAPSTYTQSTAMQMQQFPFHVYLGFFFSSILEKRCRLLNYQNLLTMIE
jgi:hypothetical protein